MGQRNKDQDTQDVYFMFKTTTYSHLHFCFNNSVLLVMENSKKINEYRSSTFLFLNFPRKKLSGLEQYGICGF